MEIYMAKNNLYVGFLKWWVSPTTIGFPTRNVHDLGCEMVGKPTI